MVDDKVPVKVSEETWRELNAMKFPGDTFEDVIARLVQSDKESSE